MKIKKPKDLTKTTVVTHQKIQKQESLDLFDDLNDSPVIKKKKPQKKIKKLGKFKKK